MIKLNINGNYSVDVDKNMPVGEFIDFIKKSYPGDNEGMRLEISYNGIPLKKSLKGRRTFIDNEELKKSLIQIYNEKLDRNKKTEPIVCNKKHIFFPNSGTSIYFNRIAKAPEVELEPINKVNFSNSSRWSKTSEKFKKFKSSKKKDSQKSEAKDEDEEKEKEFPGEIFKYDILKEERSIYFIDIKDGDAMWMNFHTKDPVALRIGLAGRNIINGNIWKKGQLQSRHQSHLILPRQVYIDGLIDEIDDQKNEYAECWMEQFTPKENLRRLQLEVYKKYDTNFWVYIPKQKKIISMEEIKKDGDIKLKLWDIKKGHSIVIFSNKFSEKKKLLLKDLRIKNGDKIKVVKSKSYGKLQIDGLTFDTFYVNYDPELTVWQVKKIIELKKGYPAERQVMYYKLDIIADDEKISVANETKEILLVVKERSQFEPAYEIEERVINDEGMIKQKIYFDDANWNDYYADYDEFTIYL